MATHRSSLFRTVVALTAALVPAAALHSQTGTPAPVAGGIQSVGDARLDQLTREKLVLEQRIAANATLLAEARQSGAAADRIRSLEGALRTDEAALATVEASLASTIAALRLPAGTMTLEIQAGEALELYVVEDESLNGLYQVREGGYLVIPQLGRVPVAGLELGDAEARIRDAIAATLISNPTVMLERPQQGAGTDGKMFVYLAGQWIRPGAWEVPAGLDTTVVSAVISNGTLGTGDLSRVRLLRLVNGRSVVMEFNVDAILAGVGLTEDVRLRASDVIFVPVGETNSTVYVTGRVATPGPIAIPLDEPLTAYSAILRSGGLSPFANLRRVYVMREVGGGQKRKIEVDISRVQRGLQPDVVLQGRDIVVVPEKFFSW